MDGSELRWWVGTPHFRPGVVYRIEDGRRATALPLLHRRGLDGFGSSLSADERTLLIGCPITQGGTKYEGRAFILIP